MRENWFDGRLVFLQLKSGDNYLVHLQLKTLTRWMDVFLPHGKLCSENTSNYYLHIRLLFLSEGLSHLALL
jgi:hypothetical protein